MTAGQRPDPTGPRRSGPAYVPEVYAPDRPPAAPPGVPTTATGPAVTDPRGGATPGGRPRRARAWLACLLSFAVALGFAAGWAWFVDQRVRLHPGGEVRGTAWQNPQDGLSYQLTGLTRSEGIVTEDGTEKPPTGAVFAIATVRISGPRAESKGCVINLIGRGQQEWESVAVQPKGTQAQCDGTRTGTPVTAVKVYQIPADRWSQVRGVMISAGMSLEQPPLMVPPN